MLPSELLIHRRRGEQIIPKRLSLDAAQLAQARSLIVQFQNAVGQPKLALDRTLAELEGTSPDFKVQRGLAHLLESGFCTFEVVSPIEPIDLRRRVFELANRQAPSHDRTVTVWEQLAQELSATGDREILPVELQACLYADLPQNRILTQFETLTPEDLIHRYNLSQVQGIFYRASHLKIDAYRNDPGEYKLLFRYLKLFQLMTYIEGDEDTGFTISIDGPTSLFKTSTRYGLALAKAIPALLHVTKWRAIATLQDADPLQRSPQERFYELTPDCQLVSHYPPGKPFDSLIEESFAKRWETTKTDWQLEREVNLVPIPGSVAIPDFRLVHPDGRSWILEIVGYWRPEYLRKKFAQVMKANRNDWILAISDRLNLDKAGLDPQQLPAKIIWFKDRLAPNAVLEAIGELGRAPS
ncbi:MAG: DUF790 family protein [Oscillatoriales cyanobacterium]|nr:MAG: DUF790 family protein [Oscillatoriales cyanobacterium]